MNVAVKEAELERAVNENINKAVESALGSWDVQDAIKKAITQEIAGGVIREAVEKAVARLDTDALSTALAEEIQRTATAATVTILREGFVDVICKLRNVSEYSDDGKKRRKEIAAELSIGPARPAGETHNKNEPPGRTPTTVAESESI